MHSLLRYVSKNVDIIQLKILDDGTYSAVIKTFWLKIIQRRWKQVYKERMNVINKRKSVASVRYCQVRGRYPNGINILPDLYSMQLLRTSVKC